MREATKKIRFNLKCGSCKHTHCKIHKNHDAKKKQIKTQTRVINNTVSSQIEYQMLHLHKHVHTLYFSVDINSITNTA